MADMCDNCLKMIKDHWKESSDGYHSFCSYNCQEKWQKAQEKLDDLLESINQQKRKIKIK